MKLLAFAFGILPKNARLHSQFQVDGKFLKITIDMENENHLGRSQVGSMIDIIRRIYPKFDQHKCCEDEWAGYGVATEDDASIKLGNVTDDIPHLFEHTLIETIATIGSIGAVSGITCGYVNPTNRYDIFVECPREDLGVLAFNLCTALMRKLMQGKKPVKLFGKFSDIQLQDVEHGSNTRLQKGCGALLREMLIPPIPLHGPIKTDV